MPVSVSVIPKYDITEGLRLIGIMTPLKAINIFDQDLPFNEVFTILADVNNKIVHVSESCLKQLRFGQHIQQHDVVIH